MDVAAAREVPEEQLTPVQRVAAQLLARLRGQSGATPVWVVGPRDDDDDEEDEGDDDNSRGVGFCDGAEALALLVVLARLDSDAVRLFLSEELRFQVVHAAPGYLRAGQRYVPGVVYMIEALEDLETISERVVGVTPPSDRFLRDLEWLHEALQSAGGHGVINNHPIQVHLEIDLASRSPDDLAIVLHSILQDVVAQRIRNQAPLSSDLNTQAVTSTQFQIVEIVFEWYARIPANAAALEYLARLSELGVRIPRLPMLSGGDKTPASELSVTQSLRALLPAGHNCTAPVSVKHVSTSSEALTSLNCVLLSAVQANRSIKHVVLDLKAVPADEDRELSRASALREWKWAAYALFSNHADHAIEVVELWLDDFDAAVVRAMGEVLKESNWLGEDDRDVIVRARPLNLASKLAFLSIVQDPAGFGSARELLDAEVLRTIFDFAAPHRDRVIDIQNSLYWF